MTCPTSSVLRTAFLLLMALLILPAPARGVATTPTASDTPGDTPTGIETPVDTPTEVETPVDTPTEVETPVPTFTDVLPTVIDTALPTPFETPTPEDTATPEETASPAETPAATDTASPGETGTPSETPVESATPTVAAITATPPETPPALATATPTPVSTAALPLNHFQCYEVHAGAFASREVSLDDQFGDSRVRVRHPKRICNPADKRGEDPTAPSDPDHLVGYPSRQTTPRFTRIRNVEVVNQFGTIFVDLVRPDQMLVPSLKSRTTPPTPAAAAVDHFKCYRVKGARFRAAGISVTDQFGSIVVDIKRPRRLCVPAEKNGEGPPIDPVSHLMCYEVRLASNSPRFTPGGRLFVTNQFGDAEFDAFRPTELCVPSLKNPSTAATATPTPIATPTATPTQSPSPTPTASPGGCAFQAGGSVCSGACTSTAETCVFVPPGTCECKPVAETCVGGGPRGLTCGGFCTSAFESCETFVNGTFSCECIEAD